MSFLQLRSKDYSSARSVFFFSLLGERLCLVLELLICIAEIWSKLSLISLISSLISSLSFWWFSSILSFNFCTHVSIVVIFTCVGLCTVFVYVWSFFVISSTVSFVSSCFIIVTVEEYFSGPSRTSFRYIIGVHGTKSGFLVFMSSENTISTTVISLKRWIFCFMVFYWVCCI